MAVPKKSMLPRLRSSLLTSTQIHSKHAENIGQAAMQRGQDRDVPVYEAVVFRRWALNRLATILAGRTHGNDPRHHRHQATMTK